MGQRIYMLSMDEIKNYCIQNNDLKNDNIVQVDLCNRFVFDSVIMSRDEIEESAFIFQALKLICKTDKDFTEARNKKEALLKYVFIMSFGQYNSLEENKIVGRYILEKGINIRFSEDELFHFVALDKSGSMAKANKIMFVREGSVNQAGEVDLKNGIVKDLFERLMLGITEEEAKSFNIQTYESKLYAYRGLYLTDSTRIVADISGKSESSQNSDNRLKLNANTVLALDDEGGVDVTWRNGAYSFLSKSSRYITAVSDNEESDQEGKKIWSLRINEKRFHISAFDGEGLICPEYAGMINEQLNPFNKVQEDATSFQIRMPFCKGMLHTVSWKDLIIDQIQYSGLNLDYQDLFIRDLFGRWRKLDDIKIILTSTMLKCNKWWKQYCSSKNILDEMEFYFSQMREYDHSLYISGTNLYYPNIGKTIITYQFLNPLKVSNKDLNDLINGQKDQIKEISKDPLRVLCDEDTSDTDVSDAGEDDSQEMKGNTEAKTLLIKALQTDIHFVKDPYIRDKLASYQAKMISDIFRGRLSVKGQLRYLSGDLLALVGVITDRCKIGEDIDGIEKDDRIRKLTSAILDNRLNPEEFYLPQSQIITPQQDEYSILRNPHLSRYEESLVKKIKGRKLALYKQYFDNLDGIVMVGSESTVPHTIGGADFDGDIVRIISDERIVNSVKSGIINKEDGTRIPIVKIPSPVGQSKAITESINPDVILDTFSNKVGHISNMSIRFGEVEYSDNENEQTMHKILRVKDINRGPELVDYDESLCAEGCILTGLELDANKNGEHPSLESFDKAGKVLSEYNKATYGSKNDYIEIMKRLKEYDFGKLSFYQNSDSDEFNVMGINGKRKLIINKPISEGKLERLPWECLSVFDEVRPQVYRENGRRSNRPFYLDKDLYNESKESKLFWFEDVDIEFDPRIKNSVRSIIAAYNKVNQEAGKRYKALQSFKTARYFGRVRTILTMQYNDLRRPFFLDESRSVEMVMLDAYSIIDEYLNKSENESREDFLKKVNKNWMFSTIEERRALLEHITDDESVIALLSDFSNRGFYLLYYVAKHIYLSYKEKDDLEAAKTDLGIRELIESGNEEELIEETEQKTSEDYRNKYRDIFRRSFLARDNQYVWKKELIKQCRKDIQDLFDAKDYLSYKEQKNAPKDEKDKKTDAALACLYSMRNEQMRAVDRGGWFFWKVFKWEEIERNLISVREDAKNAE